MKRDRKPLIAIIGDSVVERDSIHFRYARELGRLVIDSGFRLVTGGMGGVMEAASMGAAESLNYREGDIIAILPTYNPADANQFADVAIPTGMGHLRNQIVANSDAVIAVGGGAGTLTEIAFAWMLDRLIIALEVEGWSGSLAGTRLDKRVRYPEIPEDCLFAARNAEEALEILKQQLPRYKHRMQVLKK